MRIAVVGAGAIGGLVGARLALAGETVTMIARAAALEAIRRHGLRLIEADGREHAARAVRATDDYSEAGAQNLVILAVKAHQLDAVAADVQPLFGPDTAIVTMQNGVPYWYFHRHGGRHEGQHLASVDPTGRLNEQIPPERVIGCVVYPAAELAAPGVVRHVEGKRFTLGELDGRSSERVRDIAASFEAAGFDAPVVADIRAEIWLKLWGNLCFNPISALSHATLAEICRYPLSRELAAEMMREAQAVAHKLGIEFRVPLEKRIAGAERVGRHKTSTLQDIEAGRAPEIDALVGSVLELARLTDTPTPHIGAVHALVKLLAQMIAEHRGGVRLQAAAPP